MYVLYYYINCFTILFVYEVVLNIHVSFLKVRPFWIGDGLFQCIGFSEKHILIISCYNILFVFYSTREAELF